MELQEAKRLWNNDSTVALTWDTKYTDKWIHKLHPFIRKQTASAINECYNRLGLKIRITSDGHYRTFIEQNILYGKSRTEKQLKNASVPVSYADPTARWATNAKEGQSYHNYGLAVDVCIIDGNKAIFDISHKVIKVFNKYGFEHPLPDKDSPHFQTTFGFEEKDLLRKYNTKQVDSKGYIIF